MPLLSLEFSASRHTLRKSASRHNWGHLMLPMKTNGHHQAHLILPMKAQDHCQLCIARPMGASSRHQLARKHKGSGTELVGMLLSIPTQISTRKVTTKWTVPVSTCSSQIGITTQQ